MARAIYTPDPEYSESARKAEIQGTVQLAVAINATGVVDAVRFVKPLEPGLDQNAVEAVKQVEIHSRQQRRQTCGGANGGRGRLQFALKLSFRPIALSECSPRR